MSRRITSQRELSRELAERVMAHAAWQTMHPEQSGYNGKLKPEKPVIVDANLAIMRTARTVSEFREEMERIAAGITPEVRRGVSMKERQRLKAAKRSKTNSKSSKGKKHGRKTH